MYVFVSQLLRACTNTNRITVAPKKYLVLGRTLSVTFFLENTIACGLSSGTRTCFR